MCGEWILVAPVYENATTRDNIYLPKGVYACVCLCMFVSVRVQRGFLLSKQLFMLP